MDFLHDPEGNRKYLTKGEQQAFLKAVLDEERELRTFCEILYYSGARISEALDLTSARIDLESKTVTFESKKKRRRGVFRTVPLPADVVERLDLMHGIREQRQGNAPSKLWTFGRNTGWRVIKRVMGRAGFVSSSAAMPKALRHTYGVRAVTREIPLNMLQKWLGHAYIATTAIYANAIGEEEHQINAKMWKTE